MIVIMYHRIDDTFYIQLVEFNLCT